MSVTLSGGASRGRARHVPGRGPFGSQISLIFCCHVLVDAHVSIDVKRSFSRQPVLHDWCNNGRGMYYPAYGMMHIKEPLLLIGNSSLCGDSGFTLSLSEWYFNICPTPYNRKYNVLNASLNKTFPSFLQEERYAPNCVQQVWAGIHHGG